MTPEHREALARQVANILGLDLPGAMAGIIEAIELIEREVWREFTR